MTAEVASEPWLPSWTRTLNEAEALTLLDLARPGAGVTEWKAGGHEGLPQGSLPRRRELVGIVLSDLLDVREGVIEDSSFLRAFRTGSPHRRRCLLLGRYLARRALVAPALAAVVRPALVRSEVALAPAGSAEITPVEWDRWLRSVLRPGIPSEAYKKTRSTLQSALASAGCVTLEGNRSRTTRATRGDPDAVAWAWTLADEIGRGGGECDEAWASQHSFAALLFAPRADAAASMIEAGIAAGLLRRSFLAGRARLLVGGG